MGEAILLFELCCAHLTYINHYTISHKLKFAVLIFAFYLYFFDSSGLTLDEYWFFHLVKQTVEEGLYFELLERTTVFHVVGLVLYVCCGCPAPQAVTDSLAEGALKPLLFEHHVLVAVEQLDAQSAVLTLTTKSLFVLVEMEVGVVVGIPFIFEVVACSVE